LAEIDVGYTSPGPQVRFPVTNENSPREIIDNFPSFGRGTYHSLGVVYYSRKGTAKEGDGKKGDREVLSHSPPFI
jgi:hypothetical protein